MTGLEKRAVFSVSLLYIFRMLGLFLVMPVLAIYAPEYPGSSAFLVGLAVGIYGLSQALLQIPLGMASDRLGRKPIILFGLVCFIAGSLVAASAETITGIILGRFLQGAGAIASTLSAMLADLTREQHRSKAMAGIGASIGLSFAIALILGPVISARMGLSGLFVTTAVLGAVGIVLVLAVIPTARSLGHNAEVQSIPAMIWRCLADKSLMRLNVSVFSLHLLLTAVFVAVPTHLAAAGLHVDRHWVVYLPMLLLSFVAMVPIMLISERRGRVKEMVLGSVAMLGISLLSLGLASQRLHVYLVAMAAFFVVFNLLEANLPSLLSKTVYPGGRGTAMGVYSSFQFLGAFCGGAVSGLLMAYDDLAVYWFAAIVALLWLIFCRDMTIPEACPNLAVDIGHDGEHRHSVLQQLREWSDVLDITVIQGEPVVYLKMVKDFDQQQLDRLISVRP